MGKFLLSVLIMAVVCPIAWLAFRVGTGGHPDGVELMLVSVAGALLGGLLAIKQVR